MATKTTAAKKAPAKKAVPAKKVAVKKPAAKKVVKKTLDDVRAPSEELTRVLAAQGPFIAPKPSKTKAKPEATTEQVPAPAKKRVGKVEGESKMDKALAIARSMPGAARKDLIAKFLEIGLTKAGASTYVSLVRKKLAA